MYHHVCRHKVTIYSGLFVVLFHDGLSKVGLWYGTTTSHSGDDAGTTTSHFRTHEVKAMAAEEWIVTQFKDLVMVVSAAFSETDLRWASRKIF